MQLLAHKALLKSLIFSFTVIDLISTYYVLYIDTEKRGF